MSSNPTLPPDAFFPAHLWMPIDGISFDYTAYVATPAVGVSIAVVSFTVPEGHYGVIKQIGNVYIGNGFVEGSGSLVWQIQQNQGVVRNYDNMLASLGTVTLPGELAGRSILLEEQALVVLQVNNVSLVAGGTQVGGRLGGWFFPKYRLPDFSGIWE